MIIDKTIKLCRDVPLIVIHDKSRIRLRQLLLLLLIGVSGTLMTFVTHTDVVLVKAFFRNLMTFSWGSMPNLPTYPVLLVHLLLVALLMIIFPVSKLLHAPGLSFSPNRNQVDNPREQRHVADWARKLEEQS